jgi:bifunctional DNase/RNase
MIQVDVTRVVIVANVDIAVLLKERGGKRTLPIFVGMLEANSIAAQLNHEQFPRPLTHDLFRNVLEKLGCTLARAEVCDLVQTTFIGKIVLEHQGGLLEIDSRPSDAISLALRFSAPIYVAEHIMDDAGKEIEGVLESPVTAASAQPASPRRVSARTRDEKLAEELAKAVREERYEEAARIRDEMNERKKNASPN